jgi:hypothetical protein
VAKRQAGLKNIPLHLDFLALHFSSSKKQLDYLLFVIFRERKVHLDHDPPLCNRFKIMSDSGEVVGYIPHANDPNYLVYRTIEDHRKKTYIRGDGAQRSDVSQRRYLKRVAENRGLRKKKPSRKIAQRKVRWPSRPFPKKPKKG